MTPDVGDLCSRGEEAFENNDYEEAVAWYELACVGTYLRQAIHFSAGSPEYAERRERLIEGRFERYAELRKMVPWRSVQRLSAPDPGHVLAVMTCAGREDRCGKTMEALVEAGSGRWRGRRLIVDDGGTSPTGYGSSWRMWERFVHSPMRGQAATFFQVLHYAAIQIGFTYLTLLEDDVVLAKNALDYIATTRIDDDLAFIAWFSQETCRIPRVLPVLSCRPALHYDCNQAITFPARTVHELLASDVLKNWSEPHNADRIYGMVFPKRPVAVHFPNLAQHVGGLESLVGNNHQGPRLSPSFIGEGADALGLIR